MIEKSTLFLRFIWEVAKATVAFPAMHPNHVKEIVKAFESPYARGQWEAGALSRRGSARHTKESLAQKRKILRR